MSTNDFNSLIKTRLDAEQAKKEVQHCEASSKVKILKPVIHEILSFLSYISNRPDFRFSGEAHAKFKDGKPLLDEKDLKYYRESIGTQILKKGVYELSIHGLSFCDISLYIEIRTLDYKPLVLVGTNRQLANGNKFSDSNQAIIYFLDTLMQYRIKS